jgi:hypothetical protein
MSFMPVKILVDVKKVIGKVPTVTVFISYDRKQQTGVSQG